MMEYQVRILPRQVVPNPELSEEAMIGTDIPSFGRDAVEYQLNSRDPEKWVEPRKQVETFWSGDDNRTDRHRR